MSRVRDTVESYLRGAKDTGKLFSWNVASEKYTRVDAGSDYVLPVATNEVLGGVKIGDRLTIAEGVLSADTFDFFLNGIRVPETEFTKATPNLTLDSTALAGDSVIIIKNESSALEVGEAGASSENVANYLVKRDAYKMFKSNGIQIDSDTDPGFIIKFNKDDKSLEIEYVGV